ncbi:MAG: molybdopterin dehydrogenase [Hyphomicrobiales bacterium]|jgi:carbon-monoxide dehydrogenase medium subunit|nr:molybdopterin dehydrogenase [Hyphomicrobiales bacterium]
MKASAFEYRRATSIAQACEWLATHEGARLLAGGQSLIPAMNLRLAAPEILIDITGLDELRGLRVADGALRLGALVRHVELMQDRLVAQHAPLLTQAIAHVAHPAIRNRGTIGGNLAHADPASELPACMLVLDATMIARGPRGERRIAAADFFLGVFETALAQDEMLTAIEMPVAQDGARFSFMELARRSGDYAIVGLAARADAGLRNVRLGYFGVGERPMPAPSAAAALEGGGAAALEAAKAALADDLSPQDDLQGSAALRMHLARVLLARSVPILTGAAA